jgi:hypothetical protein
MKKHRICGAFGVMLALIFAAAALAGEQPASTGRTPAILASLDSGSATILDDQSAGAIRGQEDPQYKYVLVKILGVNALDGGYGVQWTWDPLGFRYGAWGGPGWTNGGQTTGDAPAADLMDGFFKQHDEDYASNLDKLVADKKLIAGLLSLPNDSRSPWGGIYVSNPKGLKADLMVQVSGISLIGSKVFFGWKPMPYSEYARREALAGMGVMVAGRSLLSAIGIH